MENINERNLVISEFQDQVVKLDGNELDSISGGVVGGVVGGLATRSWKGAIGGAIGGGLFGGLVGAALSTPKE